MEAQVEKNFQELFRKVSDKEVERNPALSRQTEKIRRMLSRFKQTETIENARPSKASRPSLYAIAGEYALLK